MVSKKITGGLKLVHGTNLTLKSDVNQATYMFGFT